jgi:hypothetical protein
MDLTFLHKSISNKTITQSLNSKNQGSPGLIARVYETDPLVCSHCGGRMKFIAIEKSMKMTTLLTEISMLVSHR